MDDGIIDLDTERGRSIGFTSDRFCGYLWKLGESIVISFIVSRAKGNFRELANRILAMGYTVKVPTPFPNMERIVRKSGYVQSFEWCEEFGDHVEVWSLTPSVPMGSGATE